MKNYKMYESSDKMITLISDNYNLLQCLGGFGISLGFGDKTVSQVCEEQNVDTHTFLAIINFTINGYRDIESTDNLSIPTLIQYLRASHDYFLNFQLPFIRKELVEALDENDNLAKLIIRLYDEYARAITAHMKIEEKTVFPYIEALIENKQVDNYDIDTYSKHHRQESTKLRELKTIIMKYLPLDNLHSNRLMATLYDIYNNEEWLSLHTEVEEQILIPVIKNLEMQSRQKGVTRKISNMLYKNSDNTESLGEREKEVIVSLVQGMTNKEIADHLCISINTVITHRRNIARKLQIHSPAGLTIYAIVNNLVDISTVRL